MSTLAEQLRPTELADLMQPQKLIDRLEQMVKERSFQNMLFYGTPGTGKTSAARILLKIPGIDVFEINGSTDTGIDTVRDIRTFASTYGIFGADMKICFIDECEYLSKNAQAGLRGVIENTAITSFLLTANEVHKLSPALKSRCLPICFDPIGSEVAQTIDRQIPRYEAKLAALGYEIERDRLWKIFCINFPDLRAIANKVQFEARRIDLAAVPIGTTLESTASDQANTSI